LDGEAVSLVSLVMVGLEVAAVELVNLALMLQTIQMAAAKEEMEFN
jgi:hypothetical protein